MQKELFTCVNTMIVNGSKSMQVCCKVKRLNQFMTWKAAKCTQNNLGSAVVKISVIAVALVAYLFKKMSRSFSIDLNE